MISDIPDGGGFTSDSIPLTVIYEKQLFKTHPDHLDLAMIQLLQSSPTLMSHYQEQWGDIIASRRVSSPKSLDAGTAI